jgi:hypothetical protein
MPSFTSIGCCELLRTSSATIPTTSVRLSLFCAAPTASSCAVVVELCVAGPNRVRTAFTRTRADSDRSRRSSTLGAIPTTRSIGAVTVSCAAERACTCVSALKSSSTLRTACETRSARGHLQVQPENQTHRLGRTGASADQQLPVVVAELRRVRHGGVARARGLRRCRQSPRDSRLQ